MKKFIILLMAISFTIKASDFNQEVSWSLYNVNTGSVLYTNTKDEGAYLYNLTAYYVDKNAANIPGNLQKSWWKIKETYLGSGKYKIVSDYSDKCVTRYGTGYRVTQSTCSDTNDNMLWTISTRSKNPNDKSFRIFNVSNNEEFLYVYAGNENFYTYSDKHSDYKYSSDWTIVPVIRRGYYTPSYDK